jgi:hypothetical protein
MYLFELGIKGVGEMIDVAEGFSIFFQMSLGGAAVGFAFALGLISVLYLFNRRLTAEENILQVAATVTFAYLTYYGKSIIAYLYIIPYRMMSQHFVLAPDTSRHPHKFACLHSNMLQSPIKFAQQAALLPPSHVASSLKPTERA